MRDSVWVIVPYANEPIERLDATIDSASVALGGSKWMVSFDHGYWLPDTLNRGVRRAIEAKATHVCWLSTGDTLHPDRFKHPLPRDKGQCCLVEVESRGVVMPDLETDWQQLIYTDNQFCGSGMIVPVHVWDAVGGFDEGLQYCSDWDFAVRVQHQFGWECVGDTVLATANEYEDGLTKMADPRVRNRDRARVAKMANRLSKGLV